MFSNFIDVWLIPLILGLPLIASVLNGLCVQKVGSIKLASFISSGACLLSFALGLIGFGLVSEEGVTLSSTLWKWFSIGTLDVDFRFTLDFLSASMVLIITGVGFLVHMFSAGYMCKDPHPAKYYAYLSLFVFKMLILVLADNLLVMFLGWEGVGLASFLLIGFWFTDRAKASAGLKAFIMNRVGDAGLLVGLFLIFFLFGTLTFSELAVSATEVSGSLLLTLALIALFVGAAGKSAQFPLYIWLPDAMAGPTPVSALIHAATMVTAGVYLFVRISPLLVLSELAMGLIAFVAVLTLLLTAFLACIQTDIKKVLAYSTVSQLGYMFLAIGVGAFSSAFFHLLTHAFFKALLFLGAGAIIHNLNHEQDMRNMGGLKSSMPFVYACFVVGWLSILGIPPFSGFFSKDSILHYVVISSYGSWPLWIGAIAGAMLTAFYMTRMMLFVFAGKYRGNLQNVGDHSSWAMKVSLGVLVFFSMVSGFIGLPHVIGHIFHIPNILEEWFRSYLSFVPTLNDKSSAILEWTLMFVAFAFVLRGAYIAYLQHQNRQNLGMSSFLPGFQRLLKNKYYLDLFFEKIATYFITNSKEVWFFIDVQVIDRATYFCAHFIHKLAASFSSLQSGSIQRYLFYVSMFIFIVFSYLILD